MTDFKARSAFDPNTPDIVLKSLFLKYDKDESGKPNHHELSTLFKDDLGFNKEQADTYSLLLDRDGSSNVSFEEFKSWLNSGEKFQNINDKSRYSSLKQAVDLFRRYDTDNSQALDRKEFCKLFIDVGGKEQNLDGALKELDRDGNGRISFQEFLRWLNWIPMNDF